MVAPGYLDGWTGLGTVASLLNNTKSILSFCHFAFDFLREGTEDSLRMDGEVTRMIDVFSFYGRKRHQIHAATTDDECTHLDRSMR